MSVLKELFIKIIGTIIIVPLGLCLGLSLRNWWDTGSFALPPIVVFAYERIVYDKVSDDLLVQHLAVQPGNRAHCVGRIANDVCVAEVVPHESNVMVSAMMVKRDGRHAIALKPIRSDQTTDVVSITLQNTMIGELTVIWEDAEVTIDGSVPATKSRALQYGESIVISKIVPFDYHGFAYRIDILFDPKMSGCDSCIIAQVFGGYHEM